MATTNLPADNSATGPAVTPVATPTATPSAQPAAQPSNPVPNPGAPSGAHNVWNDLVFAFIGTAALAIVANMNERLGRVLLSIMTGFLFMWFLLHSGQIAGWINKTVPQTRPNA